MKNWSLLFLKYDCLNKLYFRNMTKTQRPNVLIRLLTWNFKTRHMTYVIPTVMDYVPIFRWAWHEKEHSVLNRQFDEELCFCHHTLGTSVTRPFESPNRLHKISLYVFFCVPDERDRTLKSINVFFILYTFFILSAVNQTHTRIRFANRIPRANISI